MQRITTASVHKYVTHVTRARETLFVNVTEVSAAYVRVSVKPFEAFIFKAYAIRLFATCVYKHASATTSKQLSKLFGIQILTALLHRSNLHQQHIFKGRRQSSYSIHHAAFLCAFYCGDFLRYRRAGRMRGPSSETMRSWDLHNLLHGFKENNLLVSGNLFKHYPLVLYQLTLNFHAHRQCCTDSSSCPAAPGG